MSGESFKLVQLSDCHLMRQPGGPYRGRDPDRGLERAVARAVAQKPDAVVLTGDLSEDASPDSYRRLVELIQPLGCPVYWLPGNHDDPATAASIFDPAGFGRGPELELGGWRVLLLDTAIPGRPEGALDDAQLERVRGAGDDRPILVAMHHPPLEVGSVWIDGKALKHPEAFLESVSRNPNIRVVTFGHIHQAFEARHGNTAFLSTPSTAANSRPGHDAFTIDPEAPIGRSFELLSNGRWFSDPLYE